MNTSLDFKQTVSTTIKPANKMAILSLRESERLHGISDAGLHPLFRKCALAVLSSGSHVDNCEELLGMFPNFDINVRNCHQGIQLEVEHAPASAFVEGQLIEGIRRHLYAVLRDIVHLSDATSLHQNLAPGSQTSHEIFYRLRHAGVLQPGVRPNTVVCWGGHSIPTSEYDYTKEVGYHLGLRGIDICTGCGAGAMKGPMKGAAIAHAKQRHTNGRYIGLTEPGIIAAEAPNAIVNELIVMPDIEKRLEAFVRLGHALIVFPGGVGTMEELLFVLGILAHPGNQDIELPIFLTGPSETKEYFDTVTRFIEITLGAEALNRINLILGDPQLVAKRVKDALHRVTQQRSHRDEAYHFNWSLAIDEAFQQPFHPSHQAMESLQLNSQLEPQMLATNVRKVLSGIVAGNVKELGIQAIRDKGPFKISGERPLMQAMDQLLASFISQGRMKVEGEYTPCYQIIS